MAATLVQTKRFQQTVDGTTWSATFDNPTVSGNTIIVGAMAIDSSFDPVTDINVADGGTNTFLDVIQQTHASTDVRGAMLYVPNCVGKSGHEIIVTPVASAPGFSGIGDVQAMEWSGLTATPLFSSPTSTNGSTSPASAPIITPNGSGVHIFIVSLKDFATLSVTPGAGWTQILHPTGFYGTFSMYRVAANGVGQTPSCTMSEDMDNGWAGMHAVFLETSGVALSDSEWHPTEPQTNPLIIGKW